MKNETQKELQNEPLKQPIVMQSLLPTMTQGLLEQRKILIEKTIRRTELGTFPSKELLQEIIRIDIMLQKIIEQ